MKVYLSIIYLFAFVFNSFSQHKEFEFKNFTQENGLPSNESYFVYRDSKDFLWFATDQGVVRFNGGKMEHFNLPDNVVFKIREDSKGRIWFFSRTGKLAYFFNGAIYPYQYNDSLAKATENILITDAYINEKDEILINSGYQGKWEHYNISNTGVVEKFGYYYLDYNVLNSFRITQISEKLFFTRRMVNNPIRFDSINIELVAGGHTISYRVPWAFGASLQYGCVSPNGKDLFFFNQKTIVKLNRDGTYKIKRFPFEVINLMADKYIWAGFMKHGAAMFDTDLNEIHSEPILKNKSVTGIKTDHEGGIWFSTLEKGVFYLKNPRISHFIGDSSLAGSVFRLHNTAGHGIMFANTTGIYKLGDDRIPREILRQNNTRINDLFVDDNRNIIMGGTTDMGNCTTGCIYKKSKDPSYKNIFIFTSFSEIMHPAANKYLTSTYGQVVQYSLGSKFRLIKNTNWVDYDSLDSVITKPGVLFRDSEKQIWMGTLNALYRFNSVHSPRIQFKPHDTLFQKGITFIRQLENNIYCFGIRFGGIALMKDTNVIARITENEGLLSNSIKFLLPLEHQLWAATAKGISVISFQSYSPIRYTITNIGKNAGLYNSLIYQLMLYRGNLLAATSNGIYEISEPEQFLKESPKPIPFYINSINYYKGDTSNISSIILPYRNNRIVIKYSAVCFNLPEEIKYYYRFDNADSTWKEIVATELLMENLIPGTYNLEIKATIEDEQRFSDIQKLQIIVEKPWWQNNWLKLAGVIILFGAVFLLYKRRIDVITRREQQNTALRAKMMDLEQTALRSQMNPHFIFNCLTSIQQLVITGNKDEANEYLVRFARLIRKTLELSGRSFITIEEETEYLNEYLILEQLRIPGQFEFSIGIDAGIDKQKTEIPNMMLQPIIENSIRHGIKHLDNKKGFITILLKEEGKFIVCSVTDNGVGRRGSAKDGENPFSDNKSYGMDIVNRRLEAMSVHEEKESMLQIEDVDNPDGSAAGTKVTLRLPYKTR